MTPAASGGMHTNFETDFTRSESTVAVIFSAAFIVSAATVAKAAGGVGVVVVVVGDDDDDLNRRIAWVVEILSAAAVVLGTLPLEVDLGKITAGVVVVVSLLLLLLLFPLLTVSSLPFAHKTAPHFPSPVKHIPVARGSH
jgi:Mn2+/Fe2+ NRAMP family transporter